MRQGRQVSVFVFYWFWKVDQQPFFQKVLKTWLTTFLPSVKTLTKNRFWLFWIKPFLSNFMKVWLLFLLVQAKFSFWKKEKVWARLWRACVAGWRWPARSKRDSATACAANKRCCWFGYWFQVIRPDACIQTLGQDGRFWIMQRVVPLETPNAGSGRWIGTW